MLTASFVLGGVLLPAVLAGLLLALAWRAWRAADPGRPTWAAPLALAAGFLAAFVAIGGPGALPSEERTLTGLDWTFWGATGLLLLAPLEGLLRARAGRVGGWILWGLASAGLWRVTANSAEAGVQLLAFTVGLWLITVWSAERLADERSGAAAPLALWTSATGLALVSGLSGSAKLAQLSGGLAAALGAALVLAWWRPRLSLARGGATVAVFVIVALGLNAQLYSYTTRVDALLIAASLVTPLAARLPRLRELEGARRAALVFALALLPVALAVTRAALAFEPDPYAGY